MPPQRRSSADPRVLAPILLLTWSAMAFAADQLQWGERYSRNMVSGEKNLPEAFDPETGKNIKWVAPLGTESYATPVVAQGRVLIGANNGKPRDPRHQGDRGVLLCLDEADGRLLWQLVTPKLSKEDPYADWPRVGMVSSPTVEGDHVYMVSNRGEVLCLDLKGQADGNDGPFREEGRYMAPPGEPPLDITKTDADIIWVYDTVSELGVRPHDEVHCSILLHGQLLYACTSNGVDGTHMRIPAPDAPSLVVIDKKTGRLVATDGLHIGPQLVHSTWSSPSLGEVNGRTLVFFGGGNAICYAFEAQKISPPGSDAVNLKKVWHFDCDPEGPRGNLEEYQDNRRVGPSTITGMPVFHGGRIYVTAGGDLWHGKTKAWIKCIDATKSGDVTKNALLWSRDLKRHCMSTPSVQDGLVYIADCGRLVHCFDAKTGEPYWVHETQADIWGSTLVADGKVYVGTRRAGFWILAAGREKKVLARVRMDSPLSSTPVAANGVLYVATLRNLYAVQKGAGD